ncbi:MAG: UDP-glucose:undecaprenyl-phosphate glucose-phosphate transferase [Planctomycetota bacterium]|jgi:lipopolysaccharide/colanic/teichoic acid biosynthesis glycosyltransferase
MKRLFDVTASALALLVLSPLLAAAAVAVRLSSPGPVLYRARRIGRHGVPFTMFKFRTMHVANTQGSVITSSSDARVFPLGRLLRALKIDELPQLWNVLRGEMSIVGPRPEDPKIVADHYDQLGHETLTVLPGLTCPGSVHFYTHGEQLVDDGDPETAYVRRLLPIKLALDVIYVRQMSLWYDLRLIARTAWTILQIAVGRRNFPEPMEMAAALQLRNGTMNAPVTE